MYICIMAIRNIHKDYQNALFIISRIHCHQRSASRLHTNTNFVQNISRGSFCRLEKRVWSKIQYAQYGLDINLNKTEFMAVGEDESAIILNQGIIKHCKNQIFGFHRHLQGKAVKISAIKFVREEELSSNLTECSSPMK